MNKKIKLTPAQWTESLAKEELPAITSIASILNKFSNDDTSSIPKLSKFILHDQSLSSCVLRVANSSQRASVKKVTTVSRASILLGIQAIKNICLTSKILEGLLRSKSLLPEVYDRLMSLMANAFYAGLLAKIMVPNYDENTQEEVYLAAMLYHIGEISFWSTGTELTEQLIQQVNMPAAEFQKHCARMLGVNFNDLSIGLAKTWNLGDLLIKSLDKPENRTIEMNIISLANQLSSSIASPPKSKGEFDQILSRIGKIMKIDEQHLKVRIEQTRELALNLLSSYGSSILESYIKPLPKTADFEPQLAKKNETKMSTEQAMLVAIKTLSQLTKSKSNINDFLSHTIQSSAHILGFDRCTFWVLNANKNTLEARISFDGDSHLISFHRAISLAPNMNIMSYTINKNNALLVNDYQHAKWQNYISSEIIKLIDKGAICIAPVKVGDKSLGVITGQNFDKTQKISEEKFSQFDFLIEHLNMCLSMIANR
ncbi:HDOD domain-containing protein [Paraglaciecola sp. MB-3u-78]|jgi:HD-like signal output (HDOD) protein|uniref:HDOD domain-containing protein n=1 Tax=Paraglaciecola sp. MB-3u-78 TaxID=2058332 RepID=UPI000C321F71|nr:HDOD domain-containing protein [Paraglaciecola sp. MB-3u-78]PKG97104.1 hypothetical protein CXF95_21105 [Paraglaciecola sp. MB-3u-78]